MWPPAEELGLLADPGSLAAAVSPGCAGRLPPAGLLLPLRVQLAARVLPADRPPLPPSASSVPGPRRPASPLATEGPGSQAARTGACVHSRGAGRGLGERVSRCVCVCVCARTRVRGERGGRRLPAPVRTVARGGGGGAGQFQEPWAGSRALLMPERPAIGPRPPLCKRAEGMEFLGPGLQ